MGTGFDCMDRTANYDNAEIGLTAQQNRKWLRDLMIQHGFKPYDLEWWHFTLEDEPFVDTFFDFPVK